MIKPFYERKLLSNVSPVLLSASSKVNSSHMEEKTDRLPDLTHQRNWGPTKQGGGGNLSDFEVPVFSFKLNNS